MSQNLKWPVDKTKIILYCIEFQVLGVVSSLLIAAQTCYFIKQLNSDGKKSSQKQIKVSGQFYRTKK